MKRLALQLLLFPIFHSVSAQDLNSDCPNWSEQMFLRGVKYSPATHTGFVDFMDYAKGIYSFTLQAVPPTSLKYLFVYSLTGNRSEFIIDTASNQIQFIDNKGTKTDIPACKDFAIAMNSEHITSQGEELMAAFMAYSMTRGRDFLEFNFINKCPVKSEFAKQQRENKQLVITFGRKTTGRHFGEKKAEEALTPFIIKKSEGEDIYRGSSLFASFKLYKIQPDKVKPFEWYCRD